MIFKIQQYKNTWLFSYQALRSYWFHACQREKLYVRFQIKCISFSNLIQTFFFLSSLNYESILASIRICVRKYACLSDIMRTFVFGCCMCVFLYVFAGICLSLCIYCCLCVLSFVCACVCICVNVFIRVHLRWYMFLLGVNTCMCLFLSVFVCTFYVSLGSFVLARRHVCTRMCLSVCACGSACVCACYFSKWIFQDDNKHPSFLCSV